MFVTNHPQFNNWQSRLARMPRWGRIAIILAVLLPIIVLGVSILLLAAGSGLIVMAVVIAILAIVRFSRRLFKRFADDGRRNVRIVVSSSRVIDP